MTIQLDWTRITRISELEYSDENTNRGVYIWGFTIDEKFIPYYVGIAENIEYRLTEHVNFILSGRYSIHHEKNLISFFNYKNNITEAETGLIYIPNWPYGYNRFLKRRDELKPHIDYMIKTMTYSYAAISDEKISLKTLEKICINQIGKERLWNKRSGDDNTLQLIHKGDKEVTNLFINKIN